MSGSPVCSAKNPEGCRSLRSSEHYNGGELRLSAPPVSKVSQISNLPEAVLWHRNTVACLISILRQTSNPIAIEAAIGALQNLSAGEWEPSAQVRLLCGLPLIVELLHAPVCAIVSSAASALRNLSVEPETRDLLGSHALPVIVDSLPSTTDSPPTVIQRPVSRAVVDHETRFSAARLVPLLLLCLTILRGQLDFAHMQADRFQLDAPSSYRHQNVKVFYQHMLPESMLPKVTSLVRSESAGAILHRIADP
ncbi:unnamed protein product [Dibothriocephalus latus]|uniref:Armadillo repeat-containing domain-containing protein n=1 Tax=Dibothriocephalus latus TaxID=60516 RepID=A0A3P6SSG2_DIBLA|nr:unnamed protein product [Dibothriocephalus latus]